MFGLAVLLLAYSCEKPLEDPELTLSQTEVSVPADGGTFSVAFQVSNPRDGAEVSAEAEANDWVTGLEVVDNNINFDVAANEVTETRSVDVTVSYPGAAEKVFTRRPGCQRPRTLHHNSQGERRHFLCGGCHTRRQGYGLYLLRKDPGIS